MRFTASEEAGDPDTDFISRRIDRFYIVVKESRKVTTQFLCNDIFAKFLFQTLLVILRHFDNAVDIPVNVLLKHILYLHAAILQLRIQKRVQA